MDFIDITDITIPEGAVEKNKRARDFRGDDTCIYSEGVVICKSDDDDLPERLKPEDFINVDVITCAVPDWRNAKPLDYNAYENYQLHILGGQNT